MTTKKGILLVLVGLLMAGCSAPGASTGLGAPAQPAAAPKRVTIGLEGMLLNFGSDSKGPAGEAPLIGLVHGGLYVKDTNANQIPRLAETLPTQENGLWKVSPDGRMEVTWRLRADALWHDGTPITADDLIFNAELRQDPNIPDFSTGEFLLVDGIDRIDDRTIVIRWKAPYIQADDMGAFTKLRPAHILADAHRTQSSDTFLQHPYWVHGFVGAGPFRLKEFVPGSHLVLAPFDQYFLGRPKIDEITVRFFTDVNTMVANVLAGEVELTFSRGFSLAQAQQLREIWSGGTVQLGLDNWFALWPQFMNPDPPIMQDLRFRKALYHSIDRQGIVDNLWGGLTQVADTMVHPSTQGYQQYVAPNIVHYDYDLRRTNALLEELGYRRGADGMFRDGAGVVPRIQVQSSGGDEAHDQGAIVIVDYFKQAGLDSYPFLVPDAQRTDRELVSSFPGVGIWRGPNDPSALQTMHSRQAAVAPRWQGSNRSRYSNPELDALLDQYQVTVSETARLPLMGQIMRHTSEQLNLMGLWYNIRPNAVGKRLQNVTWQQVTRGTVFWNAHEWDVLS
jgi:peptide/nickel transport system substrate-binding protein